MIGNHVKKHLLWGEADSTFIILPVPENKMLLFRTRAAGVKLAGFFQSTLIETGIIKHSKLKPCQVNVDKLLYQTFNKAKKI